MTTRWIFADQLGPHFLDDDVEHVVLIESSHAFSRPSIHRAKVAALKSAMRHYVAQSRIPVTFVTAVNFEHGWAMVPDELKRDVSVIHPTSHALLHKVRNMSFPVTVLPARGFIATHEEFAQWISGRKRYVMEDFYRHMRKSHDVLMDVEQPLGGKWNFDEDNRLPPPKKQISLGVMEPWWPTEDDIDAQVRADIDASGINYLGSNNPRRFAVTREEAFNALAWFIEHRLATFGPFEDAMMSADWTMSHSLLSVPMNLGLLDPREVIEAAIAADVPLSSKEGFVRQILGWREWTWHLYWHLGPDYLSRNALGATTSVPGWFSNLAHESVNATCLSTSLRDLHAYGWVHHIPRLMVLGNWALQRGYNPQEMVRWFTDSFLDGYEWVMAANVIGMALHADGGVMATKPYAAGGAYIKRMSNYCGDCVFKPEVRLGPNACPFTAGYWSFLSRHEAAFAKNHRMGQALMGLRRLSDVQDVVAQEINRSTMAP